MNLPKSGSSSSTRCASSRRPTGGRWSTCTAESGGLPRGCSRASRPRTRREARCRRHSRGARRGATDPNAVCLVPAAGRVPRERRPRSHPGRWRRPPATREEATPGPRLFQRRALQLVGCYSEGPKCHRGGGFTCDVPYPIPRNPTVPENGPHALTVPRSTTVYNGVITSNLGVLRCGETVQGTLQAVTGTVMCTQPRPPACRRAKL